MKKNFRKLGFALSMVAMTSFAMTSCGETAEETTTEAENTVEATTDQVEETVEETVEAVEENVEAVADTLSTKCGEGDAEAKCGETTCGEAH